MWLCSFSKTTSEWISYSYPEVKISTFFYVLSWFLRRDLLYCIFAAYTCELSIAYESLKLFLSKVYNILCQNDYLKSAIFFRRWLWCVVCTSVFYSNLTCIHYRFKTHFSLVSVAHSLVSPVNSSWLSCGVKVHSSQLRNGMILTARVK